MSLTTQSSTSNNSDDRIVSNFPSAILVNAYQLQRSPEFERNVKMFLAVAFQRKQTLEEDVADCEQDLEEAKRRLASTDTYFNRFVNAAQSKGFDITPFQQRRHVPQMLSAL